jgi:6-phosphogluconolactonase
VADALARSTSREGPNGAQIVVVKDGQEVARESARRVIAALSEAVARRGVAHIALTGGSSAVPLYRELAAAENKRKVDWSKVHLWWGDERFVPIDHPESNAGIAYQLLLNIAERSGTSGDGGQYDDVAAGDVPGLDVNPANVHPIEVEEALSDEDPAELAAQMYMREINRYVPLARGGVPVFDVILSGVGPDGHIFSLFPDSPGLALDAPIVLAVPAPQHVEPHIPRVTLSARVLPVAGLVVVMSSGSGKAQILSEVLGDDRDVARWPSQAALNPNAAWVLDSAAAQSAATNP